jgi:PST family polysaccharide transporter
MLSAAIKFVAQLGIGITLARLLPPEDFGIVGIAYIATGLASTLTDLGLGPAIVQRVLESLALTFPVAGFGVTGGAVLTRQMRFRVLVKIELASSLLGFGATAVTMAAMGFGYWSLVGGTLVQTVLSSVLRFAVTCHDLRPLAARAELSDLFGFSAGVSLAGIVNYFALRGDSFAIGRLMSATSLGFYSRAYALMALPLTFLGSALSKVLFPAAVRVQDDPERFRRAYLTTYYLSLAVSVPISLGMVVLAPELIMSLYGPKWAPTIPLLQVLGLFGMFRMSYNNAAAFIHARGRAFGLVVSQIAYAALVIGGSFWAIPRFGLNGVAWAVGGAILAMWLMVVGMANRASTVPLPAFARTVLMAVWPGLGLGLCLYVSTLGLRTLQLPSMLLLLLVAPVYALAILATLYHQARQLDHPAINARLDQAVARVRRALAISE